MKLPSIKNIVGPAIVCTLAAVLVTLGVLQYRWSNEISEATSARMKASLAKSMSDFRRDLFREVANAGHALEFHAGEAPDLRAYAAALADWRKTSNYPAMIQDLYVWRQDRSQAQLFKIDSTGQELKPVEWPPEISAVHDLIPTSVFHHRIPGPGGESLTYERYERGPERGIGMRGETAAIRLETPWMLIPSIPAIVRPLMFGSMTSGPSMSGPSPTSGKEFGFRSQRAAIGWTIVVLNREFISQHLLPDLTARYFSGPEGLDFDVEVVAGENGSRVLYSSDPKSTKRMRSGNDASISLLAPFPGRPQAIFTTLPALKGEPGLRIVGPPPTLAPPVDRAFAPEIIETSGEINVPPFISPADDWLLVVNNRQGSVEAVVAKLRRRNLGLSFGVLGLLGVTMAIIILTTRRAQELARLQMEFVAGVSHELRTPLTVISSAADNLADGLVHGKEHLAHYGTTLQKQTRQLRDLVEQILSFAATQQNRRKYNLRAAQAADAIDMALENLEEIIRDAGCRVDYKTTRDLPQVHIDVPALACCLQNLIMNAIKYGGQARWVGIEAAVAENEKALAVTICDHGIGIKPEDIKHIFEPFYRSASVRDAQIHGNGLGLPVAMSIAEAMGGRIAVSSNPGCGTTFTVCLPLTDEVAAQPEVRVSMAAKANIS